MKSVMCRFILGIMLLLSHEKCAYAQYWNPEIGALLTYTYAVQYANVQSGTFAWRTRSVNYGFDFSNACYLTKRIFVGLGIRYQHFQTKITAFNQLTVMRDDPPPFTWEKRYQLFTIPLSVGGNIFSRNNTVMVSPWIGGSFGLLTTSYSRADLYQALKKDLNNVDIIYMSNPDTGANLVPTYYFVGIDIGINAEFKALPRWRIGLLGSLQLDRPRPYHYGGFTGDLNTGEYYVYSMNHSQRFMNGTLRLACKLGNLRKRARRHQNLWDCPPAK